ncbi:hypothetical protein P3X46_004865 [Hevea brasiliensis]|uniref:Reverse transcriptase domain-containing protein n=1 Tax=Hevea brasiliensis TaxID=3981 RepID=A0ABQ9MY32_HEVBR|nr:hypothetical protein P3X46_004865 [Hevea brasiliensis]
MHLKTASPFSVKIQKKVIPKKFIMPPMTPYDGIINFFPDLANAFIGRFIATLLALRRTSYLETVKQRRDEMLREYTVKERKHEKYKFRSLNSKIFYLGRKPPVTLVELIQRAEKYIPQDDALATSKFASPKREEKGKREAQPMPVNDGSSGIIHIIVGGPSTCEKKGQNRKIPKEELEVMQVKQELKAVMTFFVKDDWGIEAPHEDALVIEVIIHNFKGEEQRIEPTEPLENFSLHKDNTDLKKMFYLNTNLPEERKDIVRSLIQKNAKEFTWKPSDMLGIDPGVITHRLDVNPKARLIKQKKRVFAPEK